MPRNTWPVTWGLTPQLFLFLVLPLAVLLIVITLGGTAMHQQAMRALVGERDVRAARAAAAALAQQIDQRQLALQTLAMAAGELEKPGEDSYQALLAQAEHLHPMFDEGLAVIDRQRRIVAVSGGDHWSTLAAGFASSPGARPALAVDPETGERLILVAVPLQEEQILVGALSSASLFEPILVEIVQTSEGGVAFVIAPGRELLFLIGDPMGEGVLADHPGVAEALQGQSGATYLPAGRGEHVVAYSHVPGVNWALVIEEPWTAVASPELTITENAPLVLVPVVLFAVIALWFATHRIVQPLQNLEARASRLAWGDFSAIEAPVGGIQEIQNLQGELIQMARKLRAAQQGLRNYIGAITQGQEEERLRLARELHDDTLQALIALKQRVQLAEMTEKNGPPDRLKAIEEMADETIQSLRRVTRALRPIYLEDLGLAPALEMLVKEADRLQPISVRFYQRGKEKRFLPETELALYRITQETLNNIARHSRASQAGVEISFGEGLTVLRIWDDGIGFAVPESPAGFTPEGHYGLLGIYERVEMIGAKLSVQSGPGQGATIQVTLPEGS